MKRLIFLDAIGIVKDESCGSVSVGKFCEGRV
jgi:hypothetical protein